MKSQQSAGKEYVAVARFHSKPESKAKVARVRTRCLRVLEAQIQWFAAGVCRSGQYIEACTCICSIYVIYIIYIIIILYKILEGEAGVC